ncbi:uncharacterized protein [Choristoneura fumiferana]|uniref:uncharacterized protein n=1 Tax=Choristoneura fumiferana TaxID=7141 RepID=UPI003D159E59
MKFIVTTVLLFACVGYGTAILCYECNSVNNSMCLDPTIYDKESLNKYLRVTECAEGVLGHQQRDFFCRKIVQTILHKHRDSDVRVTRGCGWVRSRRDCYKADNEDHLETVCQCFEDGCNAAAPAVISWSLITGLVLIKWC